MSTALARPHDAWNDIFDEEACQELALAPAKYAGTQAQRMVQAAEHQAHSLYVKIMLEKLYLGGWYNYLQEHEAHLTYGLATWDEYLSTQRDAVNIGVNQLRKYQTVARAIDPTPLLAGNLSAVLLDAPQIIDVEASRPDLLPGYLIDHGIEKTHMLVAAWDHRTPQERQEMLEAAEGTVRDMIEVTYHKPSISFSLADNDDIMLWDELGGTPVAHILTRNPTERDYLLTRLGIRPKGRA